MKTIDRYVAAYIIDCLFPDPAANTPASKEYMNEILRETTSTPHHVITRNVLDLIKQGDPSDPYIRNLVAEYVAAVLVATTTNKSEFVGKFVKREGMVVVKVYRDEQLIGFAASHESHFDECAEKLREKFPGIQLVQVSSL